MSITIKNRDAVLAFIFVLCATLAIGWYIGYKKAKNAATVIIDGKNKEIERLVIKVREDSTYVVRIGQEITTLKQALAKGELDKAELKALNLKYVSEVVSLKGQIRILSDSINNSGNVIIVRDCDSTTADTTKAIKLPFGFSERNRWYQFDGAFDNDGVLNFALTVPLAIDVVTGYDKTAKEYKATVSTDNPYVIFNGVRSLKLDLQKPKKYGIGVQVGYGIPLKNPLELSPYIGLGLQYSIIRF